MGPKREVKRRKISDRSTEKKIENHSSSAESKKSNHSREERKKKSCRPKPRVDNEMYEEVKLLKNQSQKDREQSQKDRIEMENLRKQVENLTTSLKEKEMEII